MQAIPILPNSIPGIWINCLIASCLRYDLGPGQLDLTIRFILFNILSADSRRTKRCRMGSHLWLSGLSLDSNGKYSKNIYRDPFESEPVHTFQIDGDFFDESPKSLLDRGDFKNTELLVGSNREESNFFIVYQLGNIYKKNELFHKDVSKPIN